MESGYYDFLLKRRNMRRPVVRNNKNLMKGENEREKSTGIPILIQTKFVQRPDFCKELFL